MCSASARCNGPLTRCPALPTPLGIAYIALHFLGTAAFLVWLHRTHPERFPLVRNTLIAATGVALSIYLLYPVAPPRLAGLGFVDTVTHNAKVNLSSDLLGSLYNPFAAVPSLHFGYALLVGVTVPALRQPHRAVDRLELPGCDAARHRRNRQPLLLRRSGRRARDRDRLRRR